MLAAQGGSSHHRWVEEPTRRLFRGLYAYRVMILPDPTVTPKQDAENLNRILDEISPDTDFVRSGNHIVIFLKSPDDTLAVATLLNTRVVKVSRPSCAEAEAVLYEDDGLTYKEVRKSLYWGQYRHKIEFRVSAETAAEMLVPLRDSGAIDGYLTLTKPASLVTNMSPALLILVLAELAPRVTTAILDSEISND